jgi:hypothetical protein
MNTEFVMNVSANKTIDFFIFKCHLQIHNI